MLATGGLICPVPVEAQQPVNISFGQPNIWSLEQAHYLLAKMQAANLELKNKPPTETDLDPNAIHGTMLEQLKSALAVSAEFNGINGTNNAMLLRSKNFNLARREELLKKRDEVRDKNERLTEELAKLKVDLAAQKLAGKPQGEIDLKETEIKEKTGVQAEVAGRLTSIETELTALPAFPSGDFKATTATDAPANTTLPGSVLDKLVSDANPKIKSDPKLNASTSLDNHINLQYEMIAKQLTLLRDEVGPGQRLVFLELPHSIYTTPGKGDNRIAQVWWHINGYASVDKIKHLEKMKVQLNNALETETTKLKKLEAVKEQAKIDSQSQKEELQELNGAIHEIKEAIADADQEIKRDQTRQSAEHVQRYKQNGALKETDLLKNMEESDLVDVRESEFDKTKIAAQKKCLVRTIDLIPRQSSLNVNDVQDKVRSWSIAALFTLISGFGVKGSYQQQRELYSQYLHQEIYASGFGKGETDFGWTFGPLPGTNRLAPGLRTTYAILVVPDDAEAIKLTAKGCYFSRKDFAPAKFEDMTNPPQGFNLQMVPKTEKTFTIPIPNARDNNFYVTRAYYHAVKPGEQIVVSLHGEAFSSQIGVLVNGVPLVRQVSLAQLKETEDAKIPGYFEQIGNKQLILTFHLPSTFIGTPNITLVAPGRAADINDFHLLVNSKRRRLREVPMFANAVQDAPLRIGELEIISQNSTQVVAYLSGTGFSTTMDDLDEAIYVNDKLIGSKEISLIAPNLYRLEFTMEQNEAVWQVRIVQLKNKVPVDADRKTFTNLLRLSLTSAKVLSATPADKNGNSTTTIELIGTNLNYAAVEFPRDTILLPASSDKAYLQFVSAMPVTVVSIKDNATNRIVSINVSANTTSPKKGRAVTK